MFYDIEDYKRNVIRMDIIKDFIKGVVFGVNDIYLIGNLRFVRMFFLIYLGDYVLFYFVIFY